MSAVQKRSSIDVPTRPSVAVSRDRVDSRVGAPAYRASAVIHMIEPDSVEVGPVFIQMPGYKFSQPFWLTIERAGGAVYVHDARVHRYGEGVTADAALRDYASVLINYFGFLRTNRNRLSPRLQGHLHYLEARISSER